MDPTDNSAFEDSKDIVVFSLVTEIVCCECGVELWKGDLLRTEKGRALCLECADLDHLVFLPRGDAALTRRSRKYSTLSAVVLKFSRARRRYERQGMLVELSAIERAERECEADAAKRKVAREKSAVVREQVDRRSERTNITRQTCYPVILCMAD